MAKLDIKNIKSKAIVIKEPDFSYIDGKYLRDFRMKMKMSQAVFADYLGVTKKAIEKWEQGKNKVNPVVFYRFRRDDFARRGNHYAYHLHGGFNFEKRHILGLDFLRSVCVNVLRQTAAHLLIIHNVTSYQISAKSESRTA